jgi:trimethylamine--corrinoid protein Co-methyltransferase
MARIEDFKLEGGLSKEQMDIMHEKALWLTENVGLHIPHKGILDLLSNYSGVTIQEETVRFKADLVENALKSAKYPLPDYAKGPDNWVISAGAHQTKIFDLETRKIRETGMQDLIDMIKLGDALDTVGSAPVVPLDVPPHIAEILMHKTAFEYSRFRANDMFEHDPKPNTVAARYIYEMANAADKWFAVGLYMISPRSFDRKELDVVYNFLDHGIPMWAGTLPIAGVNAPITMLGAILQSMFETFGCLTMLNLINTKGYNYIQVIDSFIAHPFDMKYSTFTYGSAEDIQCALYKISLHKYYGIPLSVKSLLTSGKEPGDAQSAFEIAVFTLAAALAGARIFRCGGLLTSAEVYSGEHLVIIMEIVEYIRNLIKSREFSDERLMVNEIAEVGVGQSFIGRKSTMELFKKEYWQPELFIHSNLGQWQEMGSKSMWDYANERVKKLISEHQYRIDDDRKKELDRILEIAKKDQKLIDAYK